MRARSCAVAIVALLLASCANADIREAIRDGSKRISEALSTQATNAAQLAHQIFNEYDAQHPSELWLETLSPSQLQKLAKTRTNDLAPKLLLVTRELKDDTDCNNWLHNLKDAYGLCTNNVQRGTCLSLAVIALVRLEGEKFGRAMLREMSQWIEQLSSQRPSSEVMEKIQLLRLYIALGTEAYQDASLYARDTPIRTVVPIWLMSKGKWELALREVRELKKLPALLDDEKSALDFYEKLLQELEEGKPTR